MTAYPGPSVYRSRRFHNRTPGGLIVPPPSGGSGLAELPRVTVDVTIPIATGTIWSISSGDVSGLRNAVANAQYGDAIELEAGGTWPINEKQPVAFGARTGWSPGQWVIIRPSNWMALAAAHPLGSDGMPTTMVGNPGRMTPSRAAALGLPILQQTYNTDVDSNGNLIGGHPGLGVLKMTANAKGLYVWGVQVKPNAGMVTSGFETYWMIGTDNNDMWPIGNLDGLPKYFVMNQCMVQAPVGAKVRKGAQLNIEHHGVVNSYLETHSTVFTESCTLWTCFGRGPFRWQNNACVGAGIQAFIGGIDLPSWHSGEFPRDGVIKQNFFYCKPEWIEGHPDYALTQFENQKNNLEFKFGGRLLVEDCILDGCSNGEGTSHVYGQNGQGFTYKTLNQSATMNWCELHDVTTRYCVGRNLGAGLDVLGNQIASDSKIRFGIQANHLYFEHVAFLIPGNASGFRGRGYWASLTPGNNELSGFVEPSWEFNHITAVGDLSGLARGCFLGSFVDKGPWPYIHDSVVGNCDPYSLFNADNSFGNSQTSLNNKAPLARFSHIAVGETAFSSTLGTWNKEPDFWCAGSNAAMGLNSDGTLTPESPLRAGQAHEASDGTDRGCDMATLAARIVGVDQI